MVRFATIGTNIITHEFLSAAAKHPEFRLQAVYSRSIEKAQTFNQAYGAPLLFDSLEELAACPQVDAIYIGSTNYVHAPQALTVLSGGKHVLVEKPAGSNLREVRAMVDTAKSHGLIFMEAIRNVYQPGYEIIRNNLHKIGAVRRMVAIYCKYSSRYDAYKNGTLLNAFRPELSNSALMDIGVYCIHPMVKLLGMPDSVTATSTLLHTGFEGAGTVILNYRDKQGVALYSKIVNSALPSEIQGEKGSIIMPHITRLAGSYIQYNDGTQEPLPIPQEEDGMYHQVRAFLDAIAGRLDTAKSDQASLDEAAVMEEARQQTGIHFPADDAR